MHLMDPPDDPDELGHRFVLNHFLTVAQLAELDFTVGPS